MISNDHNHTLPATYWVRLVLPVKMNFLILSNEPEATSLYMVDTTDWHWYILVHKKGMKGAVNRPERIIMVKEGEGWLCSDNRYPELNKNLQREIEWYYKAYTC